MNFSQGHSGAKFNVNRACFPRKNTRIHTKMGEIHELFVLALFLVWFAGATPDFFRIESNIFEDSPVLQTCCPNPLMSMQARRTLKLQEVLHARGLGDHIQLPCTEQRVCFSTRARLRGKEVLIEYRRRSTSSCWTFRPRKNNIQPPPPPQIPPNSPQTPSWPEIRPARPGDDPPPPPPLRPGFS